MKIFNLKCKIIAGGANNQLADEIKHGRMLMEKRILNAPDYVINAGGLINVANELEGYHREKALKEAESIYSTLKKVIGIARQENIPTGEASNRFAERRIEQVAKLRRMHVLSLPRQIRGERYAW
jgi:leucine dehydrogenase